MVDGWLFCCAVGVLVDGDDVLADGELVDGVELLADGELVDGVEVLADGELVDGVELLADGELVDGVDVVAEGEDVDGDVVVGLLLVDGVVVFWVWSVVFGVVLFCAAPMAVDSARAATVVNSVSVVRFTEIAPLVWLRFSPVCNATRQQPFPKVSSRGCGLSHRFRRQPHGTDDVRLPLRGTGGWISSWRRVRVGDAFPEAIMKTFQPKSIALAAALLAVSCSSGVAEILSGYGNRTCDQWQQWHRAQPTADATAADNWVFGYLEGVANFVEADARLRNAPRVEVLRGLDGPTVISLVSEYCRPQRTLKEAVSELSAQLVAETGVLASGLRPRPVGESRVVVVKAAAPRETTGAAVVEVTGSVATPAGRCETLTVNGRTATGAPVTRTLAKCN